MAASGLPVPVTVTVNGVATSCPAGATVEQLIAALNLPSDRVAVERNRHIVRRAERSEIGVEEGDVFEIVTFVGGG